MLMNANESGDGESFQMCQVRGHPLKVTWKNTKCWLKTVKWFDLMVSSHILFTDFTDYYRY